VTLSAHCGKEETWEFDYRYDKKVSFRNHHGWYLCGSKDNNFQSETLNIFTMFEVVDCSSTLYLDAIPYKFHIKSPIGTLLFNDKGIATLTPKVDYLTMYNATVHMGVMNIQSVDSTYLSTGEGNGIVFLPTPCPFRVSKFPNGTIRIKTMIGKRYVAGNNANKVFLSPVDRSWEKWTIVPVLGATAQKDKTPAPIEDIMECAICNDAPYEVIFVPCGHITACRKCAEDILKNKKICPICNQEILSINKFVIC